MFVPLAVQVKKGDGKTLIKLLTSYLGEITLVSSSDTRSLEAVAELPKTERRCLKLNCKNRSVSYLQVCKVVMAMGNVLSFKIISNADL